MRIVPCVTKYYLHTRVHISVQRFLHKVWHNYSVYMMQYCTFSFFLIIRGERSEPGRASPGNWFFRVSNVKGVGGTQVAFNQTGDETRGPQAGFIYSKTRTSGHGEHILKRGGSWAAWSHVNANNQTDATPWGSSLFHLCRSSGLKDPGLFLFVLPPSCLPLSGLRQFESGAETETQLSSMFMTTHHPRRRLEAEGENCKTGTRRRSSSPSHVQLFCRF